ncbi:MAG: peptidoglycan-binding protein [Clostridia bacterium]|nr:peptidoglycan-binding protein [Clostridia bacterium]
MMKRLFICLLAMMFLTVCASAETGTVLRHGSRGGAVSALQSSLQQLGYYSKTVDGIYGNGTVAAVQAFQVKNGLKADGIAGPKTLAKLEEVIGGTAASGNESSSGSVPESVSYPTLSRGSRGNQVKTLQNALKQQGYYTKAIDGVYGSGTVSAVQGFQRDRGLPVTGVADSATQAALYSSTSSAPTTPTAAAQPAATPVSAAADKLQQGDMGSAVLELQNRLWYLGYFTGSRSGTFDADTRSAVIAFQKASRLTRDGIAGKKTLAALDSAYTSAKNAAGSLPDEAAAFLNGIAVESGAVCGTVLLTKDGEVFLSWSFGGVDNRTCFRIASITKWVTAIGLMTLYDQGRLDLDRDISEYLPFTVRNPAWPDTPVTARMLLSHTSSLSPDAQNYHPNWARIGVNGYDPIFNESVQPGTAYAYADYNGALFGCLIEAITGESVQTYLDRMVFKPLGLTAAYSPRFLAANVKTKDMLKPNGGVAISVQSDRNRAFNTKADPAGNNGYTVGKLYIDAASLTTLAQMMLGGGSLNGVRILNEDTVALMEADQPGLAASRYGLSTVRVNQFPRGTWYGHQGRYSGLSSNVYYQRETGITMVVIMDGYDYQLEDNIVLPAVQLLRWMETLEKVCIPETIL